MFFSDEVFFTWSRNVSRPANGYQLCKNPCALSLCTSELEFLWLHLVTLTPFIWDLTEEEKMNSCFMQNTVTAHTEHFSVTALGQILGEWFITCQLWHLRSPELRSYDCYVWGTLLGRIYVNNTRFFARIKDGIQREICSYFKKKLCFMLRNIFRGWLWLERGGQHLNASLCNNESWTAGETLEIPIKCTSPVQ